MQLALTIIYAIATLHIPMLTHGMEPPINITTIPISIELLESWKHAIIQQRKSSDALLEARQQLEDATKEITKEQKKYAALVEYLKQKEVPLPEKFLSN